MKITFKSLIVLWIVLLALIGGLIFSASNKLEPEALISLLTEEVQKNYPGAKLNVGNVDYRISVDLNLQLKDVVLTRSNKVLGSIGEVEFKIPWWILLFNRGNAQINLDRLEIFVDNDEPDSIKPVIAKEKKDGRIHLNLPNYLSDAKYTIRAKNISLRNTRSSRRYITISKFLVREFQYKKNSAFELNIPIEINHKDQKYVSDLWLFGDVTPGSELWRLNYRGEFKTRDAAEKFQIEDLIIDGRASFNPRELDIHSDLNLLIEKVSIGGGRIHTNNNEFGAELEFSKLPLSFLSIIDEELKNPYIPKVEGDAQGTVKVVKKRGQDLVFLNSRLNFAGLFILNPQTSLQGKWQLNFQDSRWEASFITPKGEVSYFRRSFVDLKEGEVTQYSEDLSFKGIELSSIFQMLPRLSEFSLSAAKPHHTSKIVIQDAIEGDSVSNGSIQFGIMPEQRFYQADISNKLNSFKLNYLYKQDEHQLLVEAKKFKWLSTYKILDPYFGAEAGSLDGKIEGKWKSDWSKGVWLTNGALSEMTKLTGFSSVLNQRFAQVFNLDTNTPSLTWSVNAKNGTLTLNSWMMEGLDPAKITGTLYTELPQRSSLSLMYPKNKKWKPVKKLVPELVWQKD